jgi:hypothetical protein
MIRHGLLVVALLVPPLTGWTVYRAGHGAPPAPPSHEQRLSDSAWQWRACRPNHWRDCLLQR